MTKLARAFTRCKVIPTSYGIRPAVTGNTVSFDMDRPRKVSVEFDGDITHPLLVFADPLETNVPAPDAPDVVHFAPGVHNVGKGYAIAAGKTVYLAGGAYVKGQLVTKDASGVTFRNITVHGPMKRPNIIRGHDREHRISDVTFGDVMVDGRHITSAEDGNFRIDPDSTSGVSFKVTKAGGR